MVPQRAFTKASRSLIYSPFRCELTNYFDSVALSRKRLNTSVSTGDILASLSALKDAIQKEVYNVSLGGSQTHSESQIHDTQAKDGNNKVPTPTLLLPSAESPCFPLQSTSSLPTSGTPADKQEVRSAASGLS